MKVTTLFGLAAAAAGLVSAAAPAGDVSAAPRAVDVDARAFRHPCNFLLTMGYTTYLVNEHYGTHCTQWVSSPPPEVISSYYIPPTDVAAATAGVVSAAATAEVLSAAAPAEAVSTTTPAEAASTTTPAVDVNALNASHPCPYTMAVGRTTYNFDKSGICTSWVGDDAASGHQLVRKDEGRFHDHVTIQPADNVNCNSGAKRDSETLKVDNCHSFAKPFFSLSAHVVIGDHKSPLSGPGPCFLMAFSDFKCTTNGAKVVDLQDTSARGVCHDTHLKDIPNSADIAGHSVKWVCGQADIDECLSAEPSNKHKATITKTVTHTTETVTATTTNIPVDPIIDPTSTSIHSCFLTTQTKVATVVTTNVVTNTELITKTVTNVVTNTDTVTKPSTTVFKVCDIQIASQA